MRLTSGFPATASDRSLRPRYGLNGELGADLDHTASRDGEVFCGVDGVVGEGDEEMILPNRHAGVPSALMERRVKTNVVSAMSKLHPLSRHAARALGIFGVSMNPQTTRILEKRDESRSNVTAVSGGTRGDAAVVTVRIATCSCKTLKCLSACSNAAGAWSGWRVR